GGVRKIRLNDYMQRLPMVEINGKTVRFLNNSSFGLDGQVCELGDEIKQTRKTKVSYVMLAVRLVLKHYHWTDADVTVDGETKHYKKVWIASALNGRYIGGGIKIAPGQDRLSQDLCCIVWHGTGRLGTLLRLPALLWGGHVKMKKHCDVFFGRDITVESERPCAIQLDGEVTSGVTRYHAWK
ncbi:MAG: diacylglycerol kinase family protein, partial [Oscillospiraceae bacterium]|nr:diacylglycerol kinase family protein [Oscillospiraceae bacterium]